MAFYTFLKRPKSDEGVVPEPPGQISQAKKPKTVKAKAKKGKSGK